MLLKVSGLVVFFWRRGRLICDDPVGHRQLALSEPARRLLPSFADWRPLEAAGANGRVLAEQLLEAGILIARDSPRGVLEEKLSALPAMGSAATYFHLASRTLERDEFLTGAQDGTELRERVLNDPPPPAYKNHPGPVTALPPRAELDPGLERVLRLRRSTRVFRPDRAMSAGELSAALYWAAGVLHEVDVPWLGPVPLKASPSAGARHPIEIYPLVRDVTGVPSGVYHYSCMSHGLTRLPVALPHPEDVVRLSGGQPHAGAASVLLLFTGVLGRTAWKYPTNRAYRDVLLDAGHVSQTLYLVATGLGLGAFFTAAIRDEAVESLLGLPWTEEAALGLVGLGPVPDAERSRQQRLARGEAVPDFSIPDDPWFSRGRR